MKIICWFGRRYNFSNFYLCVTLLSLCEHRCVSHLEAFSLTAVSAFFSALLRKKTEIFAEIWWKIMFRMCTNESLLQREKGDHRRWWMRCQKTVQMPLNTSSVTRVARDTFSHWRRLSFVRSPLKSNLNENYTIKKVTFVLFEGKRDFLYLCTYFKTNWLINFLVNSTPAAPSSPCHIFEWGSILRSPSYPLA